MKSISLTQGKFALVSDGHFDWLSQWVWNAQHIKGKWYAVRKEGAMPFRKTIYMHREILNAPKGMLVDHKDNDGLNNQDDNIRLCNKTQNAHNVGKHKDGSSGYKGVSWNESKNKWQVNIRVNGKVTYVGRYIDVVEAAKAYDEMAKIHHGEFALLNFKE